MSNSAELYACLYVKEFPAQALMRLRPAMRDKAFVVLEGDPPLQSVCSFNSKASRLGVAHGMTKIEIDAFTSVITLERSITEETTAKTALFECVGAFSPRIEDRSNNRLFLCGIDIAGTERLFGSPQTLIQNLLQKIKALGITGVATVSNNFHSAVCLARGTSRSDVEIIASGQESEALSWLPLSVLNLTEQHAEIFALWGIHSLGMLAALPEKELIARMGQEGKRLRQLARGELPHLFVPLEPAFRLQECIELESPVELLDSLLFVVSAMLEQLVIRASARVLALSSVTIILTLEGGASYTRTIKSAIPTNGRQLWLKLIHLDLEAHPPLAAILSLALTAEPESTSKVQLGLFSPQLPEPMRLDVTLARIRAIVGEDCVGSPALKDTHQPETFRMEPFTVASRKDPVIGHIRTTLAMRVLRSAENVSVTLRNQRPATFFFRQKRYKVECCYGPWVINGEWWSPMLWQHEQWDLIARSQDEVILSCCLMRDPRQNIYQMVGLYD